MRPLVSFRFPVLLVLLLLGGVLLTRPGHAQSSGDGTTVRGYVVDTKTKDPLPGASVAFRSKSGADTIRAQTNQMGHYSTTVPSGTYEIVARFTGYHGTRIRAFRARGPLQIVTPTLFASFTGAVQDTDSARVPPTQRQERMGE